MSGSNSSFSNISPLDFLYISISSKIFLYGLISVLTVGFIGNTCQIITFSRKTMRNVSTGILFLALSVSDAIFLLLSTYNLFIYGFQIPDRSDYAKTCQLRHFFNYLSTNFSAWMLATISIDRWFRSRFPNKALRFCTPRNAIYAIITALIIDAAIHTHLLTPMFGQSAPGVTTSCGANRLYPGYVSFYTNIWPIITILTVTILPGTCMLICVSAITVNVKNSRNRVIAADNAAQQHEKRRARFLHRQMLILMLMTVILFFLTTFPVALYRFAASTLGIQQSFSFRLLLTSILTVITVTNFSLNFYLHSLSSKLFRREFLNTFPCLKLSNTRQTNVPSNQQYLKRSQNEGTVTQVMGHISHIYTLDKNCDTSI